MDKDNLTLTKEGYQKIVEELEERRNVTRKKIADDIETAREQGDLSENAAYHSALKAKEFNEKRINELEFIAKRAEITKGNPRNKKIELGEEFMLRELQSKKEKKYQLVGGNEADTDQGKISINSPIGREVRGKKYGDKIKVSFPGGEKEFEITKPKK
ncbi:transcription elongation factor GreA [Candidatus Dojkabacteria bacterium]|nr:transcription elongation factor GreA [Candidatus Dojkabacteria bacterium]